MAKILLVVVVIAAVYVVLRAYARALVKRRNDNPDTHTVEDMVRCSHCGVHLPRSDGKADGERYFCSEEHQRLHGR